MGKNLGMAVGVVFLAALPNNPVGKILGMAAVAVLARCFLCFPLCPIIRWVKTLEWQFVWKRGPGPPSPPWPAGAETGFIPDRALAPGLEIGNSWGQV